VKAHIIRRKINTIDAVFIRLLHSNMNKLWVIDYCASLSWAQVCLWCDNKIQYVRGRILPQAARAFPDNFLLIRARLLSMGRTNPEVLLGSILRKHVGVDDSLGGSWWDFSSNGRVLFITPEEETTAEEYMVFSSVSVVFVLFENRGSSLRGDNFVNLEDLASSREALKTKSSKIGRSKWGWTSPHLFLYELKSALRILLLPRTWFTLGAEVMLFFVGRGDMNDLGLNNAVSAVDWSSFVLPLLALGMTMPAGISLLKGVVAGLLVLDLHGVIVLNTWDGGARKNSVWESMIVFYGSLASLSSPKFLVDLFLLYGASSVLWTRT
jgi:hypothetical protein